MQYSRSLTYLVACLALILGGVAAVRGSEPPRTSEYTGIRLAVPAHGAEAVRVLGDRLNDLAGLYNRTPAELRSVLLRDEDLWVDPEGRLQYVCDPPQKTALAHAAQRAGTLSMAQPVPPFPKTDTFKLHSRPSSTKKIFLDFDGHTTSGTGWNSGIGDFTSTPFDLDGNSGTFNDAEHEAMQKVWQRMSEDYFPFDVDVTTEDPGVEALRRTGDDAYGIRVVFSPTDDWIGQNPPGGIAYLTSFTWDTDTPCYVFTENVANNEKFMADAGSHEAGHTLGLNHDGTASQGYFGGQGSWGPIMGAPYDVPITTWNNGDYPSANNQEDDIAIINTFGVSLVDDYNNAQGSAFNVTGTNATITGVIQRRNDVDVFRFQTGNGPVSFKTTPYVFGPNLDLKLDLMSETGTVLMSSSPTNSMDASIATTLTPGTYYLMVDGVGNGDPLNNGYSDFGSLGQYVLTVAVKPTTPPQAPSQLTATALSSSSIGLTWTDNATTEDTFEIERKVGNGNFVPYDLVNANIKTYTDNAVTSGVTYTYRVRAVNAGGPSGYSNEASATPPYDPPATPTLRSVTLVNGDSADVVWQSNGGTIDTWELEQFSEGEGYQVVGEFDSLTLRTRITDLEPNTRYSFRVRAIGPGGESPVSNSLSVTTPPSAPIDLEATGMSGAILLSWNHVGGANFKLERRIGTGSFQEIVRLAPGVTSYVNSGLLANVTAEYRIRAYTLSGESGYSNTARATTLITVKTFKLNKTTAKGGASLQGTVTLDSNAPSGGAVITLSSDNAAAPLPATVTIPSGKSTVTFTFKTKKVKTKTTAVLEASFGGSAQGLSLQLKK